MARRVWLPVLLLAVGARAQEECKVVRSEDGKCSVEVPASWEVNVGGAKPTSLLRFEPTIPGVTGFVVCNVWLLEGQRDIHLQPFLDGDVKGAEQGALAATPETVPFPHLVVRYTDGEGERVEATAYAMVRRNGVNTQIACDARDWPRLRDAFLHMARSMQADLEEWPPHPPTLLRQEKDGFIYYVQPSVKENDLSRLQTIVGKTLHRFEEDHGKVPMPDENRPLVVVCSSLAEAESLHKGVSAELYGAGMDELGGRVFLTPVPADRGPERASCVEEIVHLLFIQRYGWNYASWMYAGEGRLAWSKERCGKDPPRVDEETFGMLPSNPVTFDKLLDPSTSEFRGNAVAYTLFFEAGPAKYKKAYADFKLKLGATRDVKKATADHLLPLDQEEMRKELDRWLHRSVKAVESK